MPKLILNGKEYANNKPDGYPPIIYSDEEREVGVWRDGKPLYQKTILCNLTSGTSATAHNIENLDFVVSLRGITNKRRNGDTALIHTEQREINYLYSKDTDLNVSMLAWYSGAYINSENIVIQSGTSISKAHDKVYIVVQYTKTTDVAGAGTWLPDGTQAHHYSTDEHIIGTWIDGKTLYEKTVDFGGLSNATAKDVSHNISNVEHIWVYDGFAESSATGFTNQLNLSGVDNGEWYIGVNKTYIRCLTQSDRRSYDICYVVLRYTKTTD